MTILDALKSMVDYTNDNLFAKVITDNGLNAGTTYTVAYKQDVDLALADVYLHMAALPEFKQGSYSVKYNSTQLLGLRRDILRKYNLDDDEITIDGINAW